MQSMKHQYRQLASAFSAFPPSLATTAAVRRFATQAAPNTIPINGTARMLRLKVNGEANAIKAQDLLAKAHQIMKKEAKGYVGSTRYVCKAEWDIYFWFRFANLDSLKGYMGSDVKEKKIEPIINELKALAVDGTTYSQNFVADDW